MIGDCGIREALARNLAQVFSSSALRFSAVDVRDRIVGESLSREGDRWLCKSTEARFSRTLVIPIGLSKPVDLEIHDGDALLAWAEIKDSHIETVGSTPADRVRATVFRKLTFKVH